MLPATADEVVSTATASAVTITDWFAPGSGSAVSIDGVCPTNIETFVCTVLNPGKETVTV